MQVELPIDETLARYAATAGAEVIKQAFETAFKGMMSDAEQSAALSQAEADLLDAAGLVEPKDAATTFDMAGESAAQQATLFATALTVEQAARQLGLDPSRIRQQVGARELYAMRHGREWRLPRFQFLASGDVIRRVPNAGRVFKALPRDLAAIAVARWFTSGNDELQPAEDGAALSPKAWLTAGHQWQPVARLATELAGEPQGESTVAAAEPGGADLEEIMAALKAAGEESALRVIRDALERPRGRSDTPGA